MSDFTERQTDGASVTSLETLQSHTHQSAIERPPVTGSRSVTASSIRILVACEFSGVVRRAFRELGFDAWSCDIISSEDASPYHIHGSVIDHHVISQGWDGLIAFPDCTFLTVSANRWANEEWRMKARHWALAFVETLWALPIKRKALENPIGVLPTMWKRPTQIIQPWQFGHPEVKGTCLWLDNLPELNPTNVVEGREPRVWKESPGPERKKNRSRTLEGVAKAMAEQWAPVFLES